MRPTTRPLRAWLIVSVAALSIGGQIVPTHAADVDDGVLMQAMRDELQRSMTELRLPSEPPPYFISYRIEEWNAHFAVANLGALLNETDTKVRLLTVELRVGDYELDNGNYSGRNAGNALGASRTTVTTAIAVDDNYAEVRRQLWLTTDAVYKAAVEEFAQKKATMQSQHSEKTAADFSHEPAVQVVDTTAPANMDGAQMAKIVRETSAILRNAQGLARSRAEIAVINNVSWFVNSEGTRYRRSQVDSSFLVEAALQTDSGRYVQDFRAAYGGKPADLPPLPELLEQTRAMRAHLEQLRVAPELQGNYSGPVLLEDQAAAELVLQVFIPALIGTRTAVVANPELARRQQLAQEFSFTGRIGTKILPDVFTVVDDPTRSESSGDKYLAGSYKIDEQGVLARRKILIEKGVLKELLVDRSSLIEGVTHSSGNARDGRAILPSNVIVSAAKAGDKVKINQSKDALLKLLRQEIKASKAPFGMVIRRIDNPRAAPAVQTDAARSLVAQPVVAAYQVFPDGREQLLRNVDIQDLSLQSLSKIIAAGTAGAIYSTPFSLANNRIAATRATTRSQPGFGRAIVSASVPSLLITDVHLGKQKGPTPTAPKIPAPE